MRLLMKRVGVGVGGGTFVWLIQSPIYLYLYVSIINNIAHHCMYMYILYSKSFVPKHEVLSPELSTSLESCLFYLAEFHTPTIILILTCVTVDCCTHT